MSDFLLRPELLTQTKGCCASQAELKQLKEELRDANRIAEQDTDGAGAAGAAPPSGESSLRAQLEVASEPREGASPTAVADRTEPLSGDGEPAEPVTDSGPDSPDGTAAAVSDPASKGAEPATAASAVDEKDETASGVPPIISASLHAPLARWMALAVERVEERHAAAQAAAKLQGGARGVSMLLLPGLVRAAKRYRGRLPWLRPVSARPSLHHHRRNDCG